MVHEGTHALAAELVGGDTVEVRLYPGRNPTNRAFQFGWTRVRGVRTRGEKLFFLGAPKLVDLILLGGYGGLVAADALPASSYGLLVVQVLATGFWVDFAKDVVVFHDQNDVVRIFTMLGLDTEWKRLPARLAYAAASAGLGYLIYLGYRDLFARNDEAASTEALTAPLFVTTF